VSLTIRRADAGDVPAIWEVEKAVYGEVVYPSFFFRQATDLWPDLLRVAEAAEAGLVGYVLGAAGQRHEEGWIVSLAVHPGHRGAGIGRRLASAAIDAFGRERFKHLHLTVHPENASAIRVYGQLGFTRGETVEDYFGPGEPRLRMSRSLPGD
jgi:[ribosomal protein S18]-alanine N-acetyltransferase